MANSTPNFISSNNHLNHNSELSEYGSKQNHRFNPKKQIINNILGYSRALEVKAGQDDQDIMVVLN
jgi:hypothetical protein